MDNLTPITREEMLMNDEPLTPITREEKILAGEDLECVTRREYFLKKYRHTGGDVMVEELSVTENGTYTAPEGKAYSPVEVAVPMPENAYLLKTASGSLVSFADGADLPMPSFICNISAVQDLHGQDAPWVGGAGKNKLPLTLENIKALNNSGTWNGNVYTTVHGMTYTVNTDDDGNVTDIEANGTPSDNALLTLTKDTAFLSGSFIGNGCPSGGGGDKYRIRFAGGLDDNDYGSQSGAMTADPNTAINVYIRVDAGITVDHLKFYPMIRLATETDPTFAPYSNICPILGHTGVDAWVRGKNLLPMTLNNLKAFNTSGTWTDNVYSFRGVTFTIQTDNDGCVTEIVVNGTLEQNRNVSYIELCYVKDFPFDSYIINGGYGNINSGVGVRAYKYNGTDNATSYGEDVSFTSTIDCGNNTFDVFVSHHETINNIKVYPMLRPSTNIDSTFEPYNPNSQTIQVSWQTEAGEVFGGYVDLVSGKLTVTDGYIASYNGETLPSTWISDRDIYAEGTTPTMGAEVVYKLANAQTYQLDGNQIKSLLGNNNAWCSTGDVDIDYFTKEV